MQLIQFLCLLLLPLCIQAQGYKGLASGKERPSVQNKNFEKEVLQIVNQIRKKYRLRPLKADPSLGRAARYHAIDMAEENYFDHDSKDRKRSGRLKKVGDTFKRIERFTGDIFRGTAENISAGFENPKAAVKSWMESPGHRANILDRDMKYLGVGFAKNSNSEYGYYWVQCFGASKF